MARRLALALVLLGAMTPSASAGLKLSLSSQPVASSFANDVATGDFNHDGKTDAVVVDPNHETIRFLPGNGDGTLAPPPNPAVATGGLASYGIAAGLFNGDANLDIVVASAASSTVSFLSGNGDGTFNAATTFAVPGGPVRLLVGQFDGASGLDLAVNTNNAISILLGNGAGSFTPNPYSTAGSPTTGIATADFNGDSKPDIATANSGTVSILLNSGTGTFPTHTDITTGSDSAGIAAGDLDGDGNTDLAVTDGSMVGVLKGSGNGTFGSATDFPTGGTDPTDVKIALLNSDSKPDIVVTHGDPAEHDVAVLLGTGAAGAAAFSAPKLFSTGDTTRPSAVAVDSFDAVPGADLAVPELGGTVNILANASAPVAAPSAGGLAPLSPANNNSPTITGASEGDTTVRVYGDSACAGTVLGTGTESEFATGLPLAVPDDSASPLFVDATDPALNTTTCTPTGFTYVEDSTAPSPPALSTVPATGSPATNPRIVGTAEPGSTYALWSNALCAGAPIASGPAADLASPGVGVSVPAATTSSFAASATDAAGNASGCSAPVSYNVASAAVPGPVVKKTVEVGDVSGTVTVKCPGAKSAHVTSERLIKLGCVVDATKGKVALTAAKDAKGTRQTADFSLGAFAVTQPTVKGKVLTQLALSGALPSCPATKRSGARSAAARKKPAKTVRRRLFGSGHGDFRTKGKYGTATVRGTIWSTEDRCDGTFVKVSRGVVAVESFVLEKTVSVRAGHSYLAPAHKPVR
jgi:hypothetical protein